MLTFLLPPLYQSHLRIRRPHHCRRHATPGMTLNNVVLIDMDNTLVDWDLEFGKRWVAARPDDSLAVVKQRKHFELEQNFDPGLQPVATGIMSEPGFYAALQPMPGAVEAVREMTEAGLYVLFCTAPTPFQYETCVAEKFGWVRKWLGEDYLSRLVVTRDKSVVKGHVLVDDKPLVRGVCDRPEWTHVIFEQSYNVHVLDRPRIKSWREWRSVLSNYYDI